MKRFLTAMVLMLALLSASACQKKTDPSSSPASSAPTSSAGISSVSSATDIDIQVQELTVNGTVVFPLGNLAGTSGEPDTFLYNLEDGDSIMVEAVAEPAGVVFTPTQTDGFGPGENTLTLFAEAPNGTVRDFTLIVCKYNADGREALNLYRKAMQLYWLQDPLQLNPAETITPEGSNPLTRIANYQEVMPEYFTPIGQQQFDQALNILQDDGEMYGEEPQRGADTAYVNTLLIFKEGDGTIQTYTAKSYYFDADLRAEEHDFRLLNVEGKWLIDGFTLPN